MARDPDYDNLPVREADRLIREQMAELRQQLGDLRLHRARRLQRELDAGRSPTQLAAEIGTSAQVVYDLTRQARRVAKDGTGKE